MSWRNYDEDIVFFSSKGTTTDITGKTTNVYQELEISGTMALTDTCENQHVKIVGVVTGDSPAAIVDFKVGNDAKMSLVLNNTNLEVSGVFKNFIPDSLEVTANDMTLTMYLYPRKLRIPAETFLGKQSGVATSLTQMLSVIRKDLWYKIDFGLPLYEKVTSKIEMDAAVLSIVKNHPQVVDVSNFTSSITNHAYTCSMKVLSQFGELTLEM